MDVAIASFPQLVTEEVLFDNRLLTHQPQLSLTSDQGDIALEGIVSESTLPEQVLAMEIKLAGKNYQCFLCLRDAEVLFAESFFDVQLSSLPELLIEAALEKILSGFQKTIKERFNGWLEVERVFLAEKSDIKISGKTLNSTQLKFKENNFSLYFLMSVTEINQVVDLFGTASVKNRNSLKLMVQLCFGEVLFNKSELLSLETGDVVFFDVCYFKQQQLRLDIERKAAWLVQFSNESITLIKPWSQEMSQIDRQTQLEQDTFELDDVKLTISFEMPEQQMPLAEIEALDKGYVFDLQAEPGSAVCVKANGQNVATGELVSVGGKLGVRLTRMIKG